jgi:hypothetical protein
MYTCNKRNKNAIPSTHPFACNNRNKNAIPSTHPFAPNKYSKSSTVNTFECASSIHRIITIATNNGFICDRPLPGRKSKIKSKM